MGVSTAWLFPGQGAQRVGMGKRLYDRFTEAKEVYRAADRQIGFALTALCFEGDAAELTRTDRCQPAIFVTSMAALAVLRHQVDMPAQAVAGLSLGEYAALAAAGAISFRDGLDLVQVRGEAMEEASQRHPGAMLVLIGADRSMAEEVCRASGAEVANLNSPGQVVVSGSTEAIARAEAAAQQMESIKRALRLDVGGAFHSSLMEPAAERMQAALHRVDVRQPRIPLVANVTADYVTSPDAIRRQLVKQLTAPTLWEASMRRLVADGARRFVELAPGTVLAGMLRRIHAGAVVVHLETPEDLDGIGALSGVAS